MRYWYFKLSLIGEVYAEVAPVNRPAGAYTEKSETGEITINLWDFNVIWTPRRVVKAIDRRWREQREALDAKLEAMAAARQ